ncbi:MAG: LysR family transcriptional regulator [Lachnospiraceae bacterium]|nr:LysR family transcriptional regulator [Lachnospiraceae bacterium]
MLYDKLNYVLAVAEEQNITRAAKRLYISQPTLTAYLNRLEADLGVKLFDRSKTPVLLTKAGQYYIDEMKKIAVSEQLLRSGLKLIDKPDQTLIIGIGQVRGHHWLPMILPVFCSIHPNVNVQIIQSSETAMSEALQNRQIDVVFGVLPASVSNVELIDLMDEKIFLIAHKKYGLIPTSQRTEYSAASPYLLPDPERLNGLPFIIPHVNNGLYNSYEELIANNHIQPSRTITVNNLHTGFQLTSKGLGVQLVSGSILQIDENSSQKQNLDFCTLENMPQTRKCVAAYNPNNIKLNLIQDVIRIVRKDVIPGCELVHIIEPDH